MLRRRRRRRCCLLPLSLQLFDDAREWGCLQYQQDWMYTQGSMRAILENASLSRLWHTQMTDSLSLHGMRFGFGGVMPTDWLMSTEQPAVTNGRISDDYHANLLDEGFTRRAAVLCFVWAQPFVTDEIKRREKMQHLAFVDFLEALARVVTFKPMPTTELLKQYGARSCAHFFKQEAEGVHEGRKLLLSPAVDWREKGADAATAGFLRQVGLRRRRRRRHAPHHPRRPTRRHRSSRRPR